MLKKEEDADVEDNGVEANDDKDGNVAEVEEEEDDFEDDDVKEEDRSDRNPQCVGACAIDMHFDMSREPPYARIYKGNAAPQDRDNRIVRA